ncbi:MAG: PrkA family serine protein kinase [Planctomycetota bacterium]
MDIDRLLDGVSTGAAEEFGRKKRILSFRELLELFCADPVRLSRTSAQYLVDVFEHFGAEEVPAIGGTTARFSLFDVPFENGIGAVYGEEDVQNEIYSNLRGFAAAWRSDRIVMLHGPNGSSKTSIVDSIMRAMEHYSRTDDGALYTYNWVFADRENSGGRLGFERKQGEQTDSLAHIDGSEITCRIPCEMKDNPLLLVPPHQRAELLDSIAKESGDPDVAAHLGADRLLEEDVCPKCRAIYDTLLAAYGGDWKRVVRHVQVERFFISKRYRVGAITIEPQGVPDAGVEPYMPDRLASLPDVLGGLQLFSPYGDLADANRGVVEYSDLLKRPLEANKYLLAASERAVASLPRFEARLDVVMFATVNELQLTAFKAHPDFGSFRGRIELVPCAYLLECSKEARIYEDYIADIAAGLHVAPGVARYAALWAVLTRMRKPNPEHFEGAVASAVGKLAPLDKARFYDSGRLPKSLSAEERRELGAAAGALAAEYREQIAEFEGNVCASYEGRWGASPREVRLAISEAVSMTGDACLTPLSVFERLEAMVGETTLYDFLRLEPEDGYGDAAGFVDVARREYFQETWQECSRAAGLVEEAEYDRLLSDYFHHVRAFVAGDKVQNPTSGEWEEPSRKLLESVEKHLEIEGDVAEFRQNLVTKAAAWSLDHPGEKLDYATAFREIHEQLHRSFYAERRRAVRSVLEHLLTLETDDERGLHEDQKSKARRAMDALCSAGYCPRCAKEVVAFLLRCEDRYGGGES